MRELFIALLGLTWFLAMRAIQLALYVQTWGLLP
jgi:hypothetical protein